MVSAVKGINRKIFVKIKKQKQEMADIEATKQALAQAIVEAAKLPVFA